MMPFPAFGGASVSGWQWWCITAYLPRSRAVLQNHHCQPGNTTTLKVTKQQSHYKSWSTQRGIGQFPADVWHLQKLFQKPCKSMRNKKSYFLGFWNHTLISLRHLLIGNSDKQRNLLRVGYCKNLKPHLFMINWNKVFCAFIKFCFYSISYQRFDLRLETQR